MAVLGVGCFITLLVLIVFIALYYKVKQQSGKQNAGHPRPHQNRKLPTTPHDQDEYELQGTLSGSHMNVTPTTAEDYSEIQSVRWRVSVPMGSTRSCQSQIYIMLTSWKVTEYTDFYRGACNII